MTRIFRTLSVFLLFAAFFALADFSRVVADDAPQKPKNIILMIGDGMGFNHYIAGAYWRYGEMGQQSADHFPVRIAMTTARMQSGQTYVSGMPCYDSEKFWAGPKTANDKVGLTEVTDSASAATALYGGQKTSSGRMGMTPDKKPLKMAAETAHEKGKATGAVSTIFSCHATPGAVWVANSSRDRYEEIFNFMVRESGLDVIMGAGHPNYDNDAKPVKEDKVEYNLVGGEETWNEIVENRGINGFALIETRKEFEQLAKASGEMPKKVLGIAHARTMISAIDGQPSTCPADPKVAEKAIGNLNTKEIPSLSTMSIGALNVLSQNENGFYVMIEGGDIDGRAHRNSAEGVVYEQTGFAKAVDAVVDWIEENSSWDETLLVITADHETGYLWGDIDYVDTDGDGKFDHEKDEFKAYLPIKSGNCGQLPKMKFFSGGHTNSLIPLWMKGPNAEGIEKYYYGKDEKAAEMWGFSGDYIDNSHLGQFILEMLSDDSDGEKK